MRAFFRPNIDARGRMMRGLFGVALLVAAAVTWRDARWLGVVLTAFGAFCLYQAARGWCLARACGIKTRF